MLVFAFITLGTVLGGLFAGFAHSQGARAKLVMGVGLDSTQAP